MFVVNLRRRGLSSPDRVHADLRPRTARTISVKLSPSPVLQELPTGAARQICKFASMESGATTLAVILSRSELIVTRAATHPVRIATVEDSNTYNHLFYTRSRKKNNNKT